MARRVHWQTSEQHGRGGEAASILHKKRDKTWTACREPNQAHASGHHMKFPTLQRTKSRNPERRPAAVDPNDVANVADVLTVMCLQRGKRGFGVPPSRVTFHAMKNHQGPNLSQRPAPFHLSPNTMPPHHQLGGPPDLPVVLGNLHHAVHRHQNRLLHPVGHHLHPGPGRQRREANSGPPHRRLRCKAGQHSPWLQQHGSRKHGTTLLRTLPTNSMALQILRQAPPQANAALVHLLAWCPCHRTRLVRARPVGRSAVREVSPRRHKHLKNGVWCEQAG